MISYGKQSISENDIESVIEVLRSDYLTQGPKVQEFENAIAEYCGAKYCVVVSNGTAALHLAVAALNLEKGTNGITSTNTFTASATSMLYSGINPIFSDIDNETYNLTLETIKDKVNSKTSLLIPVHFAGQPCDMSRIGRYASERSIKVIEDAAHAIGSSYSDGDKVGSCKYSDMTTFSFHPVKTITTGEGGAITTNNAELYNRLLLLRNHGITKNPSLINQNVGPWYYEMQQIGFNYRMCEIQAALGISQLKRLDEFKRKRRNIVENYNNAFDKLNSVTIPLERSGVDSCFHLYVLLIEYNDIGIDRVQFIERLFMKGIGTQVHYIPVHTQPFYQNMYKNSDFDYPIAMNYYRRAISLPIFPDLKSDDQNYIIDQFHSILGGIE